MEKGIIKIGNRVYISESEYSRTPDGYKGTWDTERWDVEGWAEKRESYMGRRTFMPPVSLFGHTCLLIEGHSFEILEDSKFNRLSKKAACSDK